MSTQRSSTTGGVEQSHLMYLRLVERLEDAGYCIELFSEAGATLNTISRVSEVDVKGGEVVQSINFDSEEYGKLMIRGLIHSRPICHAIEAFHKAQRLSNVKNGP